MRRSHFKKMEEKDFFIKKKRKKLLSIFFILCILCIKDILTNKTDNPIHLLIDLYPSREKGLTGEIACEKAPKCRETGAE